MPEKSGRIIGETPPRAGGAVLPKAPTPREGTRMMRVLIIGGTGLISTGIVKHLLRRGAAVTMFNRGKRENTLPPNVEEIHGDRSDFAAFERTFNDPKSK